ncbi:MAG: ATP-binding protein [Bacteroidales bacterium]|nr:ATP-binding protein [Bacteroidales bacterium]
MILGIIHNISILLALSMLHYLFGLKPVNHYRGIREIALGVLVGLIGIVLMLTPWTLQPGLVFDSRSILLSVTGIIVGPIPTIIAMATTALYRIYMAGDGILMGVASIITSGTTGILWGALRKNWYKKNRVKELLLMGLVTHILMIADMVFLPEEIRFSTFVNVGPIVILAYPLATVFLGIVMHTNIERYESRTRYREAEKRKTSFFNASKDMMHIKDNNFRYIEVNDALLDFFGKSADEVLGKTDGELLTEGDIDDAIISDNEVLDRNVTIKIEERFGTRLYEATKFPVLLESGKYGVGAVVRDLTTAAQKREIQDAILNISKSSLIHTSLSDFLFEVHHQLSTIISAKNIYVAMYDKETDMYSYPYFVDDEDVVEEGLTEYLHGSLTDYVRRSGKGKIINRNIEEELRKDGLIFATYGTDSSVWMGAPLFDVDFGEVIGVIVVQDYEDSRAYNNEDLALLEIFANNIGMFIERISIIQSLKEAKLKAEESDKLKSSFLANMSHEIRTPMNGIMGFANLLLEEVEDPEHKEYLQIITKSAERLLATINDVLDISRIEAGQVVISKCEFDLNELLVELHGFFKANSSKIDLRLSLESQEPYLISTDKIKLNQIITNLLGNAIKFTIDGYVEIGYTKGISNFTVYVRDTGIGIPEDKLDAVFDRFVQAHTTSDNEFEGTGLGLSISKLFAELLGGRIWVKSKLGEGSTFFLTLPQE